MDPTATRRYARALFGLAESRQTLQTVENDLIKVRQIVSQYPEISHLVLNSTISQMEKEDFLEKIFPGDISRLVINFLKILIKKRRFQDLSFMQEEFHRLFERKQGLQEVTVITAVPISTANQEKLKQALKKTLSCDIRLLTETDAKILGGMILRFNGTEIDGSYKNRLEALKQKLMAQI